MDERLKETVEKVVRLCRQEPEFDRALRAALRAGEGPSSAAAPAADDILRQVGRYMGLDFFLDACPPAADYGFVADADVREQLAADNREMLRFRYGTRYHRTDFAEYCRFAHLQAEMLLNYYYIRADGGDIGRAKQHILRQNAKASLDRTKASLDRAEDITSIPYGTKLYAFNKEHKIPYTVLDYIKTVRNEASHRPAERNAADIAEYQNALRSKGFALKNDGKIDAARTDPAAQGAVETEKKSEGYRAYQHRLWRARTPYDEVARALQRLAAAVAAALDAGG